MAPPPHSCSATQLPARITSCAGPEGDLNPLLSGSALPSPCPLSQAHCFAHWLVPAKTAAPYPPSAQVLVSALQSLPTDTTQEMLDLGVQRNDSDLFLEDASGASGMRPSSWRDRSMRPVCACVCEMEDCLRPLEEGR